ncbi:hypothetical protein FACS1894199_03210 [Bacteroidia bacterium]|nr:hypothetical protein FACS1894199_03210 [Bacteroidia bacterium]
MRGVLGMREQFKVLGSNEAVGIRKIQGISSMQVLTDLILQCLGGISKEGMILRLAGGTYLHSKISKLRKII